MRVAVAYTGLGLLGSIISVLVLWRSTALAWAITDTLRHELARFVLGAELAFHRDDTRDELVSRADDDVTAMAMFLSQFVARAVSVLAISIGAVAALTVMRPELGLVLGVSLTVVLIAVLEQGRVVEHGESAVLAADSRRVSVGSRAYAGYWPTTCRSTI